MIGARLGKWVIDKQLGHGGMGQVYLAHEEAGGQVAAVKVLVPALAKEQGFLQRFQREIAALSRLEHPNIVRFYESGEQDGIFYYAMEYVAGRDFESILHERGRLPWKEVLDAAIQICPALKHAHDHGIIHRDLKPPNLMRTADGVVKLTDFGIAKVFADHQLTSTGGIVGTAEFLSPEQAAGKPVTKRSDLYSFGIVLYTLLTGRPPFAGENMIDLLHKHRYGQFDRPQKVVPEIPYEIDDVVCQLLEKDPSKRPPDALVLHRQLDSIRRKLERKMHQTIDSGQGEPTRADTRGTDAEEATAGEATLMSRLMREELERQKYGGPIARAFNNVWVLLPLFLLCVGVLVWSFWPRPAANAEELFVAGAELMASKDPADWDRAWRDYLGPLNRMYRDHPYQKEVEQYRQQVEDQSTQRDAILKGSGPAGAAQRFYEQGLDYCRQGDPAAARRVWRNVVGAFAGIDSEARWVRLAGQGLAELDEVQPSDSPRDAALKQALRRARQLREEGRAKEADEILSALEALYQNDPLSQEVLKEVRRERP